MKGIRDFVERIYLSLLQGNGWERTAGWGVEDYYEEAVNKKCGIKLKPGFLGPTLAINCTRIKLFWHEKRLLRKGYKTFVKRYWLGKEAEAANKANECIKKLEDCPYI